MLKKGDQAPINIKVRDNSNNLVSLSDNITNKFLVVYFYPQDNTTGCTIEAYTFRDYKDALLEAGATIVGISMDDVDSHKKFHEQQKLNFPILSDTKREIMEKFGVLIKKNENGENYRGVQRSTFLLDKNGLVLYVWELVTNSETHPKEVLEYIQSIT